MSSEAGIDVGTIYLDGQPTGGTPPEDLKVFMNAILEVVKKDPPVPQDDVSECFEHFANVLTKNSRDKLMSRKNLARTVGKIYTIKRDDCYTFYRIKNFSLKSLRINGVNSRHAFEVDCCKIQWIPTPKGRVYFTKIMGTATVVMLFSHFFDRLSQRSFDSELTRLQAIYTFLRKLGEAKDNVLINSRFNVEFYMPTGVAIGHGANLLAEDEPRALHINPLDHEILSTDKGNEANVGVKFILFATYVSENMLHNDQVRRRDQARQAGKFWHFDHKVLMK
jgi:hypothetical protein